MAEQQAEAVVSEPTSAVQPITDKVESQVNETKVETVEDKPKDPMLSSRFAALAKREKSIVRRAQEIKQVEQKLQEQAKTLEEKMKIFEVAKTNPMEALKQLGLSYQDITNFVLNDSKITPDTEIKHVRTELESFKKQQEEKERLRLESETQRAQLEAQEVINDFKSNINEFLTSKPDDYELTTLHEAQELVYATIEEHFNNTKRVLSIKEAADLVEKYLEERIEASTKTKKLSSKFKLADSKAEEKASPAPSKTLTNQMSSSAPSMLPAKTESDRIKRAMAALEQKGS